jgi:hypothetical protein
MSRPALTRFLRALEALPDYHTLVDAKRGLADVESAYHAARRAAGTDNAIIEEAMDAAYNDIGFWHVPGFVEAGMRLQAAMAPVRRLLLTFPDRQARERGDTIYYHGHDGMSYSTDGENPELVSREHHLVLKRFLDRDEALSSADLKDDVNNVHKVLRELQQKYGPKAVHLPGKEKKGAGYFIRVRSI